MVRYIYIYIYITDSLCCTAETNTVINHIPVRIKNVRGSLITPEGVTAPSAGGTDTAPGWKAHQQMSLSFGGHWVSRQRAPSFSYGEDYGTIPVKITLPKGRTF